MSLHPVIVEVDEEHPVATLLQVALDVARASRPGPLVWACEHPTVEWGWAAWAPECQQCADCLPKAAYVPDDLPGCMECGGDADGGVLALVVRPPAFLAGGFCPRCWGQVERETFPAA